MHLKSFIGIHTVIVVIKSLGFGNSQYTIYILKPNHAYISSIGLISGLFHFIDVIKPLPKPFNYDYE